MGAAPARHCPTGDARPVPGLGLLVASIGAVLGKGEALALASRIPARVSGRSVAQWALPDWHVPVAPVRHLFPTPLPAWPRVSVSPIDVSTHTDTHTVPHFRVLPFTLHTMDHPIHKQRTLDTQPHTAHPSTSTPYTAVCDDTHHLPDTPYQALTTIHTTPRCYTQAPTTPHPRPQTSQRTTHSSASQIPTTQHRSVSHHIHLDFSSPQHEHLGHHRCLLLSQHVRPQTSRSLLHPSTGTCAHRCHSNPDFHNHDASANALSVTASTRRSPTAHRAGTTDAARGGPCPHTCTRLCHALRARHTRTLTHTCCLSLFRPQL